MIQAGTPSLTLRASATILPGTFVVLDNAANETVKPAGANAVAFGLARLGTKYAPGMATIYGGTESGAAAFAGDPIAVHLAGDVGTALAGGPVTAGDDLETDANGCAVTSTVSGHNVVAKALQTVASGQYVRVQVLRAVH